jgi:superfamily II DNA/RNA helicase
VLRELASGTGRRLLFTRTKHQAKKLAKQLTADGIPAVDLQGNLGQGARERNLAAFTSGDVRVLVATDIAARGIHVDDVELVVHVDPPAEHKAYLHRSGRTARAGSGGVVVTLQLPEQAGDVRDLTRKAKITVTPERVAPGSAVVASLVGEVAAYVAPAPVVAPVRGTSTGRNATAKRAARSGGGESAAGGATGGGRRRRGRGGSGGGAGQGAQVSGAGRPAVSGAARPAGGSGRSASGAGRVSSGAGTGRPSGSTTPQAAAGSGQPRRNRSRRAGRPAGPAQSGR